MEYSESVHLAHITCYEITSQYKQIPSTMGSVVTARLETAHEPSPSHIEPSRAIQRLMARNRSGTVQAIFRHHV